MSYQANFQSALSYFKLGDIGKAVESLYRAYEQVPSDEKTRDNGIYLKTLSLLARFGLEQKPREHVWNLVNEGLAVKDDHVDLLFLKALMLLDEKNYDDMLVTLISYVLHTRSSDEAEKYRYELIGEKFDSEVFENLLPAAYRQAPSGNAVRERLASFGREDVRIQRALAVMADLEAGAQGTA